METAPLSMRAARWCAFDLNPEHVAQARRAAVAAGLDARIEVLDVFHLSGETIGNGLTNASVLVIGNPPWVTAAAQGARGATNLPSRNGGHGLSGLDSITGRSNFDTGEAVVLRVLSALIAAREVHLAVLVKRTVAMKLAKRFLGLPGVSAATFSTIDARRFFGASVDAGLFQLSIRKAKAATTTKIRLVSEIGSKEERLGEIIGGRVITDMVAYRSVRHLEADATYRFDWRQGIKHDCSRVLELIPTDAGIVNGLGEPVDVEPEVLCPLYKCSDLAAGRAPSRLFPLYQTDLTGPFHDLGERWPRLARYLEEHVDLFRVRRSRIYEGKPDFTLFGVGDYSLAPFKVAVSGLHKQPRFRVVGPGANGAPPLVDDTSYTLACSSLTEAEEAAAYLNGDTALAFLCEIADPLAKRPFTKDVLTRLRPPGAPAQLFVPAA